MSKGRKLSFKARRVGVKHGIIWIGTASLLALLTGLLVVWLIRQPLIPHVSVVSPVMYSSGDETYQPGTERKYAIVEVEITNSTEQAFNFAPVVQTYLMDTKGIKYEMAPVELSNPIVAGVVKPGETRRGQLSYNVPKDVEGLEFHFVTDDEYHISYKQRL